ncbi:hypothetical protein UA75_11300 [Actinoalloteichus sp. GBA129-24]|nr:hypothetical protein UA75_11300 [Actinoalloteichus sp. GBA129-24]
MSLEEVSAGLARTLALITEARSAAVVASAAARDGAELMAVGTQGSHSDAVAAASLMHDRTQPELGAAVETLTAAEELIRGYRRDVLGEVGDPSVVVADIADTSAADRGNHDDLPRAVPTATTEAENSRRAKLIAEARRQGLKISAEEVRFIGVDPNGRIVWIENGWHDEESNEGAGLAHIMSHANEFTEKGIGRPAIGAFVLAAIVRGQYSGYDQGKRRTSRPIFKVNIDDEDRYVGVQVGSNGFIIGANMRSSRNPYRGARRNERANYDATYRGW